MFCYMSYLCSKIYDLTKNILYSLCPKFWIRIMFMNHLYWILFCSLVVCCEVSCLLRVLQGRENTEQSESKKEMRVSYYEVMTMTSN